MNNPRASVFPAVLNRAEYRAQLVAAADLVAQILERAQKLGRRTDCLTVAAQALQGALRNVLLEDGAQCEHVDEHGQRCTYAIDHATLHSADRERFLARNEAAARAKIERFTMNAQQR